jgi:conjugative transfer signal peptidase TraF
MPELRPLPLMMWVDRQHLAQLKRKTQKRRAIWLVAAVCPLFVTIILPPRPTLIWNRSASATHQRGSLVVAWPPRAARAFAAERHYLPRNIPLIKRITGQPGDLVCAQGRIVTVNGNHVAIRRAVDGSGRPLPWWHGCRRLSKDAVFLLMQENPASFDGRYFGLSCTCDIVGRAIPLWAV